MAPVSMGPRELADVILVPFEMAIRLGGARSVMPTYVDIDGIPASADPWLLTTLLRDEYGFDGVVVSDYYAVSFLELQHAVAADPGHAAVLALTAGLDVELPGTRCFGEPLLDLAVSGEVPHEIIDRAVARVLRQKLELGLLDPGWIAVPGQASGSAGSRRRRQTWTRPRSGTSPGGSPRSRSILLKNDAAAPEAARCRSRRTRRVAVIGPLADDPLAFFGCYSMPRHLGHAEGFDGPGGPAGVEVATLLAALRAEGAAVTGYAPGCAVRTPDRSGFAEAVSRARSCRCDRGGRRGRGRPLRTRDERRGLRHR